MSTSITPAALRQALDGATPPLVIDVRRPEPFRASTHHVRGALRRDPSRLPEWMGTLPTAATVVAYCARGHEVSQQVAHDLDAGGIRAQFLEGGLERWIAEAGEVDHKPAGASSRWVTRERPKIDRIACPWLILRFIDPEAEFLYVPTGDVRRVAAERDAVPYDVPDVRFSHEGDHCSFDAFLAAYRLHDPALAELAVIVRGADTGRLELAPQAAGLAAISLGLSRVFADDHEMLAHGMVVYDALYRWCKEGKAEIHTWNPDAYR